MVLPAHIRNWPMEAVIWSAGLLFLAFSDPSGAWTICPLHNLGIDFCPGCGLGRSVSFIFKGEWATAWSVNPLGYLAVPVLMTRIYRLFHQTLTNNKPAYHGKST